MFNGPLPPRLLDTFRRVNENAVKIKEHCGAANVKGHHPTSTCPIAPPNTNAADLRIGDGLPVYRRQSAVSRHVPLPAFRILSHAGSL
jgi:hypothetical protein